MELKDQGACSLGSPPWLLALQGMLVLTWPCAKLPWRLQSPMSLSLSLTSLPYHGPVLLLPLDKIYHPVTVVCTCFCSCDVLGSLLIYTAVFSADVGSPKCRD